MLVVSFFLRSPKFQRTAHSTSVSRSDHRQFVSWKTSPQTDTFRQRTSLQALLNNSTIKYIFIYFIANKIYYSETLCSRTKNVNIWLQRTYGNNSETWNSAKNGQNSLTSYRPSLNIFKNLLKTLKFIQYSKIGKKG